MGISRTQGVEQFCESRKSAVQVKSFDYVPHYCKIHAMSTDRTLEIHLHCEGGARPLGPGENVAAGLEQLFSTLFPR